MKFSEITVAAVKEYLRLETGNEELSTLMSCIAAAKSYIKGYTGLTEEELDMHEDVTIAFMVLVQDMYDNRSFANANNTSVNRVVDSILSMHARNLI